MELFQSRPNKPALFIACAASILIAVLAAGGPFFDITRSATSRPVTLAYSPGGGHIITSVGTLDKDAHAFKTTNTPGALVYGPYITLPPGHYIVSWTGTAGVGAKPKFEIFSTKHGTVASGTAPVAASVVSGLLQRVEFDTAMPLNEVELRVVVNRDDELSIDGVTLQIQAAKGAGHE
ncbi:hypothetical protein ACSUZJ_04905 [Telluria sp. B2]